jgi:hypothetical protein
MGQYDIYENHQWPCNREDSSFACGEISSRLCVTCLREAGLLIPTRFGCAGAEHEVASVDDRWPGMDHEYVKVGTPSGDTYILRHDIPEHVWQITLFREAAWREDRPTGRAPSSRALRLRSARS